MSLISGLFTFPTIFAFKTYCEVAPVFNDKKRTESYYNALLEQDSDLLEIKNELQPFLDDIKIRTDLLFVKVCDINNSEFCSALGTNIFTKCNAMVLIAPDNFHEIDKDACNYILKHEISHIKHNDNFTTPCVAAACQLTASIFGMYSLSFFPAVGLALAVGFTSNTLFEKWREAKADDFAIKNSSDEELKGGRRFFMAMQAVYIENRDTFWKRIIFSANGNNRLGISHPSLTSRIQKIEKVLQHRKAEIDEEVEKEKLENIKICVANIINKLK